MKIGKAAVLGAAAFLCAQASQAQEDPNARVTPFMMADGLYYVGAADLAAYVISTDGGLILIDGGVEATAPIILENLKFLGFEPAQVKILLNTHAHIDNAGGLAALKKATGATLYASAEEGAVLASGGKDLAQPFPVVKPDKILRDGEQITLGAAVLTAHLTPGHTKGCTTWTFPVKADGVVRQAVLFCSTEVGGRQKLVNNPAYPNVVADFQKSFALLEKTHCDVFLAGRARVYKRAEKRLAMRPGAPNPFVDPQGCKAYIAESKARFEAELKKQQAATP